MAAGDSSLGIIEAATDTAVIDSPAVDTSSTDTSTQDTTNVETDAQGASDSGAEGSDEGADLLDPKTGLARTDEELKALRDERAATAKGAPTEVLPQEARAGLKALKDLDGGKYAKVVKELHGSFERYAAIKEIAPGGVTEIKQLLESAGAKTVADLRTAVQNTQQTQEMISSTDELLYNADPTLCENVWSDMEAAGKGEQYGKVVSNFVEHLKGVDEAAHIELSGQMTTATLRAAGFVDVVNALAQSTDPKSVKTAQALAKWFNELEEAQTEKAKEAKIVSRERQALEKEKSTTAQAEKSKFENSVAESCEKTNNTTLGRVLGSNFLKLPFFKDFKRETLIDLGNGIKDRLYNTLKADKTYQAQMNAMWKQKNPDRAKIEQYHKAKLEDIAPEVVRLTVQNRYPGYAKGGTAAGRVASAQAKTTANTKAAAQSVSSGKPIYVATRPANIVREPVTVNGKDYSASDLVTMQIAGRAFVKTTDGRGYKLVTWRRG